MSILPYFSIVRGSVRCPVIPAAAALTGAAPLQLDLDEQALRRAGDVRMAGQLAELQVITQAYIGEIEWEDSIVADRLVDEESGV